TVVRQPVVTRAHTEEMLLACGADLNVSGDGLVVRLRPSTLEPFELDVPGDPSQAAFWIVAACIVPGSDVTVEGVYIGPARTGFLDVLTRMGADVERVGDRSIRARYSPDLHGTDVNGGEVADVIDEIPALAMAAAVADGGTRFADAGELRVKESDRIDAIASALNGLGARVETVDDGFAVQGGAHLRGGHGHSRGDHRIAMALAVAGLAAEGTTTVEGWEAVATSYPGFGRDLEQLCGS
ncbi:MAG: 3-phosphoshikimate 1-carboxyvinyltransferase, partial [Actinomycetota bacterium]|nr:3-phosphoshikimate 1-carboxyvinyltransferase [Actinomycetota bacterium]